MSLQEHTAPLAVNAPTRAIRYQVIPADQVRPIHRGEALISEEPGSLERVARQYLDGGSAIRGEVIINGRVYGMYIDALCHLKDLPRNELATALYRAEYLAEHPEIGPESLPFIAGPAVLFGEP